MTLETKASDPKFRRSKTIASYSMIAAIVAVTFAVTLRAMESDAPHSLPTEVAEDWTDEVAYIDARSAPRHVPSVSSLIGGLEQRLAENPYDGRGWLLLAKSYEHLARYDDARTAFARAAALGVTDDALPRSASTLTPQEAIDIWAGR